MNPNRMFNELGWDKEQQIRLEMIVSNTRDTMKHAILGMRATSMTEEPFIRVYDRSTNKLVFDSEILDSRDRCHELYDALIKHYGLPYCCLVHTHEMTQLEGFEDDDEGPAGLDGFEDDPEDEGFDLEMFVEGQAALEEAEVFDMLGLEGFEDDDEEDFGFNLDDDEEDFDFDLD